MTAGLLPGKGTAGGSPYRVSPNVKLAEAGIIQSIWSPNFDGLTAKAASQSTLITAIDVGIDCQERLFRRPKRSELICVSLHGDYRYDPLKNTTAEFTAAGEVAA